VRPLTAFNPPKFLLKFLTSRSMIPRQ
jgi:hypothetical protein